MCSARIRQHELEIEKLKAENTKMQIEKNHEIALHNAPRSGNNQIGLDLNQIFSVFGQMMGTMSQRPFFAPQQSQLPPSQQLPQQAQGLGMPNLFAPQQAQLPLSQQLPQQAQGLGIPNQSQGQPDPFENPSQHGDTN